MSSAAPRVGTDEKRDLLRHVVATIAYRGGKVLRGAPAEFARYSIGNHTRSGSQILAHVCDLLEWSLRIAKDATNWRGAWMPVASQAWDADVDRFFRGLKTLDDYLAAEEPLATSAEVLFQGPLSDALTHVGQLAMLRRGMGAPIRGEVMILADVIAGRVGPDQNPPQREFD